MKTYEVTRTKREEIVTEYVFRVQARSADEAEEIACGLNLETALTVRTLDSKRLLLQEDADAIEIDDWGNHV